MKIAAPLLLALASSFGAAQQTPDVTPTPGGAATAARAEPVLAELTRRDRGTLLLTLNPSSNGSPARTLALHGFAFNGEPVDTAKLHLRQLSPGVFELTSRSYEVGYWRFAVRDEAAGVYGLGEHFDTLNHAHTVVRNLSLDNPADKGSGAYKPIPFYLSTTGYGLWLDTTGEATFDLDASDRREIAIEATTDRLRLVLFTGAVDGGQPGRFPAILSRFAALAGPVTVPPPWAFAPWHSRDFHRSDADVLEDVDRTRALGLPASVIVLDSPWATAYNSYVFNPKQFADAPATIRHLHAAGFKLVLWHTPWIDNKSDPPAEPGFENKMSAKSPNYDEAAAAGFFVKNADGSPWVGTWWKGQGSLIDFTNPRARAWWQKQVGQAIAAGADGFKDDDGEGAYLSASVDGADPVFADGTDPRLMRNRYGTLFNNATEEPIQRELKGDGVLFARSVTTGANGIGFVWGGDNAASFSPANGLPTAVTAGLSAGLSGMPLWASDLGGYLGEPDTPNPLLLERWTEFSAFSPVMEIHSTKNLAPWTFDRNSAAGTTPALDIYKRYAVLHMSLFPYRYAAALEAARTGAPILRALVLDFQDDPKAREIKDEYLFGRDLLVAPIVDENTSRVVYLPAGEWLNLFTGEALSGPATRVEQAPPDTIPVYARRGAVLPRIPEDVMTLVPAESSGNKDLHTLDARRVYELLGPAAPAPTTLVDFEGRKVVRDADSITFSGGPPAHVILRWKFQNPHEVTVDGAAAKLAPGVGGVPTLEFEYTGAAVTVVAR